MSTKEDGGQAFPQPHERAEPCDGMTLRDYFAAKAMQALMPFHGGGESTAKWAYAMADRMLEARK